MKIYLNIITLLFLCINAFTQIDTNYNKILHPFPGATSISSLLTDGNYYYALVSEIDTPDFIQNYGFLKINKTGDIVDTVFHNVKSTIQGVDMNYGHGFIMTSDSSFLYCGGTKEKLGRVLGFLVKTNYNFDTLWTKIFYHPDTAIAAQVNPSDVFIKLSDIKETPDGGYIIIGNYNENCIGNARNGFLIKTDTLGNPLWINLLPTSLYDIEIDRSDSGFFFPASTNGQAPLKLFKTDKFGNTIWSVPVNTMPYPSYPMDAEFIDSNTFIVASSFWVNSSISNSSVVIASVNTSTHSTNWEKTYSFYDYLKGKTLHQTIGANLTSSGNIAISSTVVIKSMGYKGSLLLINQNGDSLWQRYYAHTPSDSNDVDLQLNDLVVCDDGGFLMGGFYKNDLDMYSHAWLVKTDSLGFAPAAFTLAVEEKHLIITQQPLLYPNPAQSNINLRFKENPDSKLSLLIYNSAGVLVKQEKLSAYEQEYRINIEDLEIGVYFISILSEKNKVFSGKFVKI